MGDLKTENLEQSGKKLHVENWYKKSLLKKSVNKRQNWESEYKSKKLKLPRLKT